MAESAGEMMGERPEEDLLAILDRKLDVEALAQQVEQMDLSAELSKRLQRAFGGVRGSVGANRASIHALQQEVRDLIVEVELLKRAAVSLGQVGVMERQRIERELIRQIFPPERPRESVGIVVASPNRRPSRSVDCESRLPLCKAACCRVLDVHLTPGEIHSDRYDWNPKVPYTMRKNRHGCTYVHAGGCACSMYLDRPVVCRTYSCAEDSRIWKDFENRILNPELEERLKGLHVVTGMEPPAAPGSVGTAAVAAGPERGAASAPLEDVDDGASAAESAADAASGRDRSAAQPPDFSQLRELMIPPPKNVFKPPPGGESPEDAAAQKSPDEEQGS